ncbi:MAG: HNH endonuclease [Christensenellaceae bacterium]|nr:HNH endonuclease [Christensenellaceae bacterium]
MQPAEITDHIQTIREGGTRLDMDSLQNICRACHNRKHGEKLKLHNISICDKIHQTQKFS